MIKSEIIMISSKWFIYYWSFNLNINKIKQTISFKKNWLLNYYFKDQLYKIYPLNCKAGKFACEVKKKSVNFLIKY